MTNTDQQKRIKASNALYFLRSHPAFSPQSLGDSLFDGLGWFHMTKCCKRGKSESCRKSMSVYRGDEGWRNVKSRFDKEYKKDDFLSRKLQSVDASYKEIYGEPWKFDHVEYWYETRFFIFEGNPYAKYEFLEYQKWDSYNGPEGGANTFEDAIIQCANAVKRNYGNFNIDKDFLTEAEIKNHKENSAFLDKILDENNRFSITPNPEYMGVNDGIINLRWWEWYMTTKHFEKWNESAADIKKTVASLTIKMPASRKKLIEKYS